jgi:hypothetical protein
VGDLRSIIQSAIEIRFKWRCRNATVLIQSRLFLFLVLVFAHKGFDPVGIIAFNIGALLTEIPKFVHERDTIDEMLIDDWDLVLYKGKRAC